MNCVSCIMSVGEVIGDGSGRGGVAMAPPVVGTRHASLLGMTRAAASQT